MEFCQRSVYDVLLHNLELSKRKAFLHRVIFAGEHRGETEIEQAFTYSVNQTNASYCEEKLTGVLIIYPNYFIHLMDGDEIVFGAHVMRLYLIFGKYVKKAKLLTCYHHINQRFFDTWVVRRAKPPILLEKINPNSDLEEFKRQLGICVTKMYNLALELRQMDPETDGPITVGEILPYMNQYLPEYVLLEFLLNQNILYDMTMVLSKEAFLMDTRYSFTHTWPVQSDYVPLNVFEEDRVHKVIPSLK